jgi:hypothetical protein
MSSLCPEKTTKRKDSKMKSPQDDKTPSEKSTNTLYNPLICRLFVRRFDVLHVVFLGRKDDNYRFVVLSFCRLFEVKRRQNAKQKDDKFGR